MRYIFKKVTHYLGYFLLALIIDFVHSLLTKGGDALNLVVSSSMERDALVEGFSMLVTAVAEEWSCGIS